jgi:hypothetical protein
VGEGDGARGAAQDGARGAVQDGAQHGNRELHVTGGHARHGQERATGKDSSSEVGVWVHGVLIRMDTHVRVLSLPLEPDVTNCCGAAGGQTI